MNGILPPLILFQIQVSDKTHIKSNLLFEAFHNHSSQQFSLSPPHSSHMGWMLFTLVFRYLDFISVVCFVYTLILKIKIRKKEIPSPVV